MNSDPPQPDDLEPDHDPSADLPEQRGRGLWGIMPQADLPDEKPTLEFDTVDEATDAPRGDEPVVPTKGLWSVMGERSPGDADIESSSKVPTAPVDGGMIVPMKEFETVEIEPYQPTTNNATTQANEAAPRGLWGIMSSRAHHPAATVNPATEPTEGETASTGENLLPRGMEPRGEAASFAVRTPVDSGLSLPPDPSASVTASSEMSESVDSSEWALHDSGLRKKSPPDLDEVNPVELPGKQTPSDVPSTETDSSAAKEGKSGISDDFVDLKDIPETDEEYLSPRQQEILARRASDFDPQSRSAPKRRKPGFGFPDFSQRKKSQAPPIQQPEKRFKGKRKTLDHMLFDDDDDRHGYELKTSEQPPKTKYRSVRPPHPAIEEETRSKTLLARAKSAKRVGRSKKAVVSFVTGLTAIASATLALNPEFWMKLPSVLLGFFALMIGFVAIGEIRRSRGNLEGRIFAMVGIVAGIAGMYLGPAVIARIGDSQRAAEGQAETATNLKMMGSAFRDYHEFNDHFPARRTIDRAVDGTETVLHSWMTELLPHIDERNLFSQIDMKQPFHSPVNFDAMSQEVDTFYAAGGSHARFGQGYAVSHYSGVGGNVTDGQGDVHESGLFSNDSPVRRVDISDGLSQTLIVGEIGKDYPPWGDPGNWRVIGDGLNKGPASFGSADGNGASFLKADGSVQFFSNKVAVGVLERLSTRNGDDTVPEEYR